MIIAGDELFHDQGAAVAQRLVRRICSRCRTLYTPDALELAGAKVTADTRLRDLHFTTEALEAAKQADVGGTGAGVI